jgi:hypothetical protein
MESDPNQSENPHKGKPIVALLIGFAPAALGMATIAVAANITMGPSISHVILGLGCLISILCCIVSSRMLFRRRTASAVVGGVLLLLLNGFIALFFGCAASFNS